MRAPGRGRWLWLAAAGIALLVFEVTSDPALSVAVGCLKFGVGDLASAVRAWRAPADPTRGRVVATFLVAWGFWKTTAIAIVVMVGVVNLDAAVKAVAGQPHPGGVPDAFVTAAWIALGGATVSTMLSTIAVVSALRAGVRVWIGGRRNRAGDAVMAGMIVVGVAISLALFVGTLVLAPESFGMMVGFLIVSSLCWYVALPFGILALRDVLGQRILLTAEEALVRGGDITP